MTRRSVKKVQQREHQKSNVAQQNSWLLVEGQGGSRLAKKTCQKRGLPARAEGVLTVGKKDSSYQVLTDLKESDGPELLRLGST